VTVLAALFLVIGTALILLAAVGLIRLRDPLQRMHSATKAGTLGTTLLILGVLLSGDGGTPITGVLAIVFLLFTLPIGAQLLGRATYLSGTPLSGIDRSGPDLGPIPGLVAPPGTKSGPKPVARDGTTASPRKRHRRGAPPAGPE